jgi:N-acetylmuramoyl-L-alanine amidase
MTFTVKSHKLFENDTQVRFHASPNTRNGMVPKYLVLHYTASDNFENVLKRFSDPTTKVSAHFVVSRTGQVGQCAPLNIVTYHAGTSEWKDIKPSLNGFSFGIEICNFGILTKKGNDWFTWTNKKLDSQEVFLAKKGRRWQKYSQKQ